MTSKYQITGTVGDGYKESAYFNPESSEWETGIHASARYDISTLEEAKPMFEFAMLTAMIDLEVSDIKIVKIEDSEEA